MQAQPADIPKVDLHEIGRTLTAVTMGIDAFERAQAKAGGLLDGEGLVPIYIGADLVPARPYADWDAVRADLAALAAQADRLPEGPRRVFLTGMVRSLTLAVRLFAGESLSFADKVEGLVGAPTGRESEALLEEAREAIGRRLERAGVPGRTLQSQVEAWERDRALPPERLEATFRELMAEAKRRTDEGVFDTGGYDMALHGVHGTPYTARCSFSEGRMDLNLDLTFTRAALKHLVCHEVYPGHSTQLLSTHAAVDAGAPADALLVTANAITGCVQEGIGDQGVHLIDFVEDEDDEMHLWLRRLRSAAQTSAAWMLMAEGRPRGEVEAFLRDTAMGQEAWVQGRLAMAAHPFRGPFIASYFAGNESVRRVRERIRPERRGAFLATLYGEAHSPQSLEMFE